MPDIELALFPFNSTAITVTTTVWVGVVITVLFNLRFGWTLSGLVVPGYLVPLLMTRPITAGVVIAESIITYLVVLGLSELPRRRAYWSSLFGRDRFFAILVVSVLVRSLLDGWLLPVTGQYLVDQWGINFDYRNNFHSFGLIVVALIANYFWKPGLRCGFLPLMTTISLTYLVIRFVFIELTNFNLGNFHLLYEDVSASLLASPKAYIIVLTTAYLASWFNLRYAWDFNGILIPALMGLMWHEPLKIFLSIVECCVLLTLAKILLRLPVFRNVTMEGSRKILFFFSVCFAYRFLMCHLMTAYFSEVQASDAFGFGYLLTTLMAIKINDRKIPVRFMKTTLEVSILGAVAGSLIGFAFYVSPDLRIRWPISGSTLTSESEELDVRFTSRSLAEVIRSDKLLLYEKQQAESYVVPVPNELTLFNDAVRALESLRDPNDSMLQTIAQQVREINYEVIVAEDRYVVLHEKSPANGWGIYIFDTRAASGLAIEVPAPLDEPATIESGLCLFHNFSSSAMAIAGTARSVNLNGDADVTLNDNTFFSTFHRNYRDTDILQIRGLSENRSGSLSGIERPTLTSQSAEANSSESQLWVRGSIPDSLKLNRLKELMGTFHVQWNESPMANRLRENVAGQFAELILSVEDRRRLIGQLYVQKADPVPTPQIQSPDDYTIEVVDGHLREWMQAIKERICAQGSNEYRPALLEEMLYMDHEVLTPLVETLNQLPSEPGQLTSTIWRQEEMQKRLLPIQASARSLGYELKIIVDRQTDESYLALVEIADESNFRPPFATENQRSRSNPLETFKGWGTFVFRPGFADPYVIEIPRPLLERRSFDFGVNLYDRPRASVLLVAGAHPRANLDGSSDISKAANKTNLFNLVRHVLLRQLGDRPLLIAQARAIQAPVDADIVLATDDGTTSLQQQTPLKQRLLEVLSNDQLSLAFVDGRRETAGYELGILLQATAVQVSQNKEVVSLWLSPSLRSRFREQTENSSLTAQFVACKIPTIQRPLIDHLSRFTHTNTNQIANSTPLPADLKTALSTYLETQDVVRLLKLRGQFDDWEFERLVDGATGQAYLLVSKSPDEFPSILNMTGYVADKTTMLNEFDPQRISDFIRSRALWLLPRHVGNNQSPRSGQLNKTDKEATVDDQVSEGSP